MVANLIKDLWTKILGGTATGASADSAGSLAEQIAYIAANVGGGGAWDAVIVKEADESVSSTTTLQDDDELSIAVAANEVWQGEAVVFINSAATPDFKFTIAGPTGAVGYFGTETAHAFSTTSELVAGGALGAAATITSSFWPIIVIIRWGVHNGANAGNIRLQWAQNTSDAAATTVLAGSSITGRKEAA